MDRTHEAQSRSATTDLDYAALFEATPSPCAVLGPDLVLVEVNRAYLKAAGRTREDLLGRYLFDSFPENRADPKTNGMENLRASLDKVLQSREPDTMALQHCEIPMGRPEVAQKRWWLPVNTPILGPDRAVKWIVLRMDDVTPLIKAIAPGDEPSIERAAEETELYARALELNHLNQELRLAHMREHEMTVTLQRTMLMTPDFEHHDDVAVRYLPADDSLAVSGDWYDLIDLQDGRFALTIGDVVGHGLEAAAVMGMLRSVVNAAARTLERPAQALEVLGLFARSIEGAMNTTSINALVDPASRLITYTNAGHPPPVLLHSNGECELLNQALDPPLGARPQHVPCSQAGRSYIPGDTLVLYTDGLIERRGEDIDVGLDRLITTLGRHSNHDPEVLADALMSDLGVGSGLARDDIALIVVGL
ncbi:SpoIIE family protein phosphatase [Glycomyces tritici]|uniref:SpoIIE family protein phosphatase n=1 Tax=Glycomyces tritici TaxID=2665176 RepID=A0ABT7YRL5_9ACTN|nr:SpoIIE family protein phosphatase [Glycomyces tritici]MDN3241238.1 SpoIIE family protein phosphatase [Glycomyces tritici]MDN3243261.1 SpoIIE family protein phosphatase [Glycomyces tritici]